MTAQLTEEQLRQMVTDLNGRIAAVEALALPTALAQFSQRLTNLEALDLRGLMAQVSNAAKNLEERAQQLEANT